MSLFWSTAGMFLAQAKRHWRQFSNDCRSVRSANTLTANTRICLTLTNTLAIGGKLLLTFYSLEFALLAFNLSKTAPTLYLLNRSVIRASYAEHTLFRCASKALGSWCLLERGSWPQRFHAALLFFGRRHLHLRLLQAVGSRRKLLTDSAETICCKR